jgi:hypothetical protein
MTWRRAVYTWDARPEACTNDVKLSMRDARGMLKCLSEAWALTDEPSYFLQGYSTVDTPNTSVTAIL